jgi:hypothetical protein
MAEKPQLRHFDDTVRCPHQLMAPKNIIARLFQAMHDSLLFGEHGQRDGSSKRKS